MSSCSPRPGSSTPIATCGNSKLSSPVSPTAAHGTPLTGSGRPRSRSGFGCTTGNPAPPRATWTALRPSSASPSSAATWTATPPWASSCRARRRPRRSACTPRTRSGRSSTPRGGRARACAGSRASRPACGVELPRAPATAPIGVHTPDQVRQVLDTARRADLDVCRVLAVRYFAGVRSAEAHRLRESDLKLDQGFLEVPASKSKTRSRRLVTIQPNLKAWLALGGELRAVGDMTIRKVIKLSKVDWVHNATRHSFVSYHLAEFENAGKTALEAGHSETMPFAHYRALVTPAAAKEYWAILPAVQ